ncbi:MAG: serine/threonine protein kinase, partial [Oscillochloris sp.]|nr:serine/threonine protein kinase [Oscillochloris sp.]
MPLPLSKTIKDRYLISRVISTKGGFGNTYLAYDDLRKQDIVIKESKTAADIEQDALLSELRILLSLDHPRLPKVYDGFFYEGQLCVTMQYIPGRDVSTYLVASGPERRADPPDRPTALRWISQTLEALAYLHSRDIIHRDVKPSNLRVNTETGDIFLLDFGISHQVERSMIRAHSPFYSPPEQHDPNGVTTPASDIYAVGATLYLLLTGLEPPYRDDHYDKTVRLLTEERQTIPVELENVVLRAMRYDPADRYPNAQAMLNDLQRLGYAPRPAAATLPLYERDPRPARPAAADSSAVPTMATITAQDVVSQPPAEQPGGTTQPSLLPVGTIIHERYHIRDVISERGGFGTTYRAFDIERNQEVVIKVSKTTEDIQQNALLAERDLLSKLKHRRLPAVYDAFFYNHLLCIEMQYIRGRDVSSYLRDEPLDRRSALRWAHQLLEALDYLHQRSIIHCDIKPSNLRIDTESGDLFLIDFGISQRNNQLVVRGFSRHYSAPEQRDRRREITPATDTYAVGAILYTFLTGAVPPEHNGQTEPVLFPDQDRHAIPDDLKRMVRKALKADPAERYPHARAMLDDLERLPYARPGPRPALLWGLGGVGVLLLVLLALALSRLLAPGPGPSAVAATTALTTAGASQAPAPSTPPDSAPAPAAQAAAVKTAQALLVAPGRTPTSTAQGTTATAATPTPEAYLVRQIDVQGQPDSASIYVGQLPVKLSLIGERLDSVDEVVLQPKAPGQRPISLRVTQAQAGRVDAEIASLPSSFRGGAYDLLINGQPNRAITLRDYLREARIQGVKIEYRHLAAIRPFPSYRFQSQDILGPFGLLYAQPDPTARGVYVRNGDLIEILDDSSSSSFYRVRLRENFDSSQVGREGWMWAWVVNDTPPAPPTPGAIQMPYNIRSESKDTVVAWLVQRGVPADSIFIDSQTRERIPEVFDSFKPDQVVSSDPAEGGWITPGSKVVLGVRA